MQATQTLIIMDRNLLSEFKEVMIKLCQSFEPDTIKEHALNSIYQAV